MDPTDRRSLLHQFWPPAHAGYPGEVVAHDEYLECPACGWSYPLDQGDDYCSQCEMEALLEVRRAHPAPQSTLRMALGA